MSKTNEVRITRLDPAAAIPGGEITILCENLDASQPRACRVEIGSEDARISTARHDRVMAIVPDNIADSETQITLQGSNRRSGEPQKIVIGRSIAEDVHAVANPAFDPDDGALFVTRSGSRGQRLPVTVLRVDREGNAHAFSGEVINPTGLAFSPTGEMHVSSRLDGNVYKVEQFDEATIVARDCGVATGLAFDRDGQLYVGDRTGTIYRINAIGEAEEWASLEPSVAAYHLAFGRDGYLYVTGPSVSSNDVIRRIDRYGNVETFFRGLGRPQGIAFDDAGHLYVAASLHGRRGIIRINAEGSKAEMVVAAQNVVGLAFSKDGDTAVATNDTVYLLPLGIYGTLLT